MAATFVSASFTDARSLTTGVPEMCTGAASVGERNTRRFAVSVAGLLIAVFSLIEGVSVKDWKTSGA